MTWTMDRVPRGSITSDKRDKKERRGRTAHRARAGIAFRATLDADRRHEQRVIAKRCSRTTALSSALRKFERSRGPKALGPDVAWPVERRWSIRLRVARAMPIELSLKRFPFGAMTSAPNFTHRLASGMSDVTTIAPGPARSAIQSSAASVPAPTTTRSISAARGTTIGLFATTKTISPWRAATR